jgi:peptide-methionine (S)-S-oxide reductase
MNPQALARPAKIFAALLAVGLVAASFTGTSRARQQVPDPSLDAPLARSHGSETAVFAGGCFWGIEAVFEHVKGVKDASSGYAGGSAADAEYETVSTGRTGHAESVKVVFDPAVVSYGQLLKVFFAVAHDPTQLNQQSPDHGPQYRSAVFFANGEQQRIARAYIAQMGAARIFGNKPIVTQVVPLRAFYPAERHHQDFARLNPTYPYILIYDAPKVSRLKQRFPGLYRDSWAPGLAATAKPRG